VKLCLISATSIFALLSASIGPAHSAVLNTTPGPLVDIFDLVHDGATSSDGGDRTVTKQDLSTSALTALRTSLTSWQAPNFTGMRDIAGNAYPTVPLGAAVGITPEIELASPANGMLAQDSARKAYEIGKARMASLIGTAGPSLSEKTGNTVFVAAGSAIAFNDGGNGAQGSPTTYTFGPGSTSTATITIAGAGNLSRQRGGGAPYVVASNSLQVTSPVATDANQGVALSEAAQPTLGYNYTPAANTVATGNAVAASFSDAITAAGLLAQNTRPVTPAKVQTSQVQPNAGQSATGAILTSQVQPSAGQTANGLFKPARSNSILLS